MTTPEGRATRRTIAAMLLALVFVAGAAAGVAADRLLVPRPVLRTRIVNDISGVLDRLGLTPEQRRQADEIVQRRGSRTEDAMRALAERLRSEADSVDAALRAILTTEQRARLDSLRRHPVFMLKRKGPGNGITVDTVLPAARRDTVRR